MTRSTTGSPIVAILALPAAVVLLRRQRDRADRLVARRACCGSRKHGNRKAGIVNRLLEQRERLIGALLLGNNAVNILASSLATSVFLAWFGDVGVIYATALMTVLVVVFAEVLPKTCLQRPGPHGADGGAADGARGRACSGRC